MDKNRSMTYLRTGGTDGIGERLRARFLKAPLLERFEEELDFDTNFFYLGIIGCVCVLVGGMSGPLWWLEKDKRLKKRYGRMSLLLMSIGEIFTVYVSASMLILSLFLLKFWS